MAIKLTEEKINPPIHAKEKNTNVPVKNIAVAFRVVPVVIYRSKTNFINKARNVKYQYSIVS